MARNQPVLRVLWPIGPDEDGVFHSVRRPFNWPGPPAKHQIPNNFGIQKKKAPNGANPFGAFFVAALQLRWDLVLGIWDFRRSRPYLVTTTISTRRFLLFSRASFGLDSPKPS